MSQKVVISPFKINILKKFNQQRNRGSPAVLLMVDFFSNIDFQRRYDHFFETPKSLFFALWHGYVAVWQFTLHSAMLPCPCVDDTQQQHTGTRLLEALLSCGG